MEAADGLTMWVIYCNPRDFPGRFVVRRQLVGHNGTVSPASSYEVAATLEEARSFVPSGLYRLSRDPKDDPVIAECWI